MCSHPSLPVRKVRELLCKYWSYIKAYWKFTARPSPLKGSEKIEVCFHSSLSSNSCTSLWRRQEQKDRHKGKLFWPCMFSQDQGKIQYLQWQEKSLLQRRHFWWLSLSYRRWYSFEWVAKLFVSTYHESSSSVWEHSCKQQPAASQGALCAKQIKSPWKRLILFKCPWYCLYKIILNVNSTTFATVMAESWTNLSLLQSLIYLFRRGS